MADTTPINASDLFGIINGGSSAQSNAPINAQNFSQITQSAPANDNTSWADVPIKAIANIPNSAINAGKGIWQAISHPIDTASGIIDIAAGGLHNITPAHIANWIDQQDQNPEAIQRAVDKANQVGKFYKERYGSSEGFKQALANDPVGVALDASSLLSGSAGIASKLGLSSDITNAVSKAGAMTSPITAPITAAGKIGAPTLGLSTGVGAENIANAAKSGFNGDKTFIQNLRGELPMTQPLDDARANLNVMRQNRNNVYRSGMTDISKDKSILSFDDINDALNQSQKSISFSSKIKDDVANDYLGKIKNEVYDWQNSDPSIYHTPEGMDALKQRIGAINNRIPYEESNANRIGGDVYNSIKSTISDQAPVYDKVMKDYSTASDSIQEIEKALSLGNKSSADTALRKLQSLSRNNANTNYGNRLSLAQQLEMEGGKPFINALSGQALSSPTARGLAGSVESMSALGGFANPAFWGALPFQTPRLVGEGLYLGGRAAKAASNVAGGITPQSATRLSDLINMNQQTKDEK